MNEWGDIYAYDEDPEPQELESASLGEAIGGIFASLLANDPTQVTRDPAAGRMDYRTQYLRSERWRQTRARAIAVFGRRCMDCQFDCRRPDVHHLTYERLGNEHVNDLAVLCRSCHRKRHGKDV